MPKGEWLYLPNQGHDLNKFKNSKQTQSDERQFRKEVDLFLRKYDPEVLEILSKRGVLTMNLEISDEVVNDI